MDAYEAHGDQVILTILPAKSRGYRTPAAFSRVPRAYIFKRCAYSIGGPYAFEDTHQRLNICALWTWLPLTTRPELIAVSLPLGSSCRPDPTSGEKGVKIGEGTFANVYKGERLQLHLLFRADHVEGKERATGRQGMKSG